MAKLKTPATMMTQHPDACRYIPIQEEPEEAISSLTPAPEGLGLEEAMIDFEGKLTPYLQTSQVVLGLLDKGAKPGKDVFVTPRIPSSREESVFRQLMALMSIVESNYYAWKKAKIYGVREVILPMTSGAEELLSVRDRITDVINLAHKEFGLSKDPNIIQLIPLIETIPQIIEVQSLLTDYLRGLKKMKIKVERVRYMLGRSDLALSFGLIPAVLFNKIAISQGYRVQKEKSIEISPILGGGTLPFRGHLTLENVENTLIEYSGIRTITIQSAMHYDHGLKKTRKLAEVLKKRLPRRKPLDLGDALVKQLIDISGICAKHYLKSFYQFADEASRIASFVPRQRDRLTHTGETGYARNITRAEAIADFVADKELAQELKNLTPKKTIDFPRAISYTAAMYSIGLPPEIIGTGRGLHELAERYGEQSLKNLFRVYPSLKADLAFACRFVSLDNASEFVPHSVISQAEKDLKHIWRYLKIKVGPQSKKDRFYFTILETMKPMLKELIGGAEEEILTDESVQFNLVKEWIVKLGQMRGGLG